MIKLNIEKLMKDKGFTYYYASRECGMSYDNFKAMVKNKTKSIKYESIENLCYLFDCTPNDLFLFTDEESSNKYKK